jgi:3-isopropylmalate/(R)-2-methylmalate dehydratase large subunit
MKDNSLRGKTIIDKILATHLVANLDDGQALLHIDRILLHERTGPALLAALAASGRRPANPDLVFGTVDHIVDTTIGRSDDTLVRGGRSFIESFRYLSREFGIRLFDLGDADQGITHVLSPELGIALPGTTLVCPDSHTCTIGGLGALAWGIGSTEGEHAVATQTLVRDPARRMRIELSGTLDTDVVAKDVVLALIGKYGAAGGAKHAIEFCGSVARSLDIEGRLTLCNMAVEFGAWTGLIAPDDRTFSWIEGRRFAPKGQMFDRAVLAWRLLSSDEDADWDATLHLDCSELSPQVTWGTSPEHVLSVQGAVPDPDSARDGAAREAMVRALAYVDLRPGQPMEGLPIEAAFIGSCTNARISDLRAAAGLLIGRQVAPGVKAIVVPGSMRVKAQAEAEGLDSIFRNAGFEWRESGCSLCFFAGGDSFGRARRVISSTNRNFEGRQGPGVRTHLASPLTVAASAIRGAITDPRQLRLG